VRTERKKPLTYSFILTEQDLWTINDVILKQMRSGTTDSIDPFFVLTYKNGVTTEKASLDDVIAENNSHDWEIYGLKMGAFSRNRPQKARIEVEFRVPPPPASIDATRRPHSIYYRVLGDDRVWVNLTSSQLDDRIAITKRLPILYYGVFAICVGFVLGVIMSIVPSSDARIHIPLGYVIATLIASGLIMIGGAAATYGFPLYNFCWGDNIKKIADRRKVGIYIINGVIITLLLGSIGSIIGTLFFLKSHIPQFRERKNRIVNTQDQAGEESADEELAVPGLAFASVSQRGYARDQCPQNTGKPSASWGEWLACSPG
jgi:hypothetical protein